MSSGAIAVMIPSPAGDTQKGDVTLADYADWLDALVLEGGSDVSPTSYGETPLQPKWGGDRVRDDYERALLAAFAERGKPVLGICRGLQLMNVAFGGTLLQDIASQRPGAREDRDAEIYDRNVHPVEFVKGTRCQDLRRRRRPPPPPPSVTTRRSRIGARLRRRGACPPTHDEAIRGPGQLIAAVRHPEFHRAAGPARRRAVAAISGRHAPPAADGARPRR